MKTFITNTFLLETETARELYFNGAADQPIYDYHCHLSPQLIAENHSFRNLYEIWLAGDHYKWRAMRANGIKERFCTGDASDREKYDAFVRTVPYTLRNPLYHWSHLELLRYFDLDVLINEESGGAIWEQANARLATPELSVHGILEKNRVAVVVTTDDPTDSLEFHQRIRKQGLKTRVYPAFRPDGALKIGEPAVFNAWCAKLSAVTNSELATFAEFLAALKQRHDFFHEQGCRLSDHGLNMCLATECDEKQAAKIFDRARQNQAVSGEEVKQFGTHLMLYFGHLDAKRGWTKQLHLGAIRNTNSRQARQIGADSGFDSIGDFPQAAALGWYLDRLDSNGDLPRMVLYNVNPTDNYILATMAGNFQDGSVAGKIQFGSGWWFLDQLEGMTWQINALSSLGLLRRFVGMLTDSRSFLSYTRHEYFRRLLCNIIGNDVEKGLLPRDEALLRAMVREICFDNARGYFGLQLDLLLRPFSRFNLNPGMANLRDLAAAAHVSIRTVNRVLKREGYVHEKTRRAVDAAVRRLGYQPNLAARSLKTAKSHLVAVLTFTEDELRMAQVAALEQRLREADFLVSTTFHFESQKGRAARIIRELIGQKPAGIVLLGHDPFVAQYILPALVPPVARSGIPYVLIDPRGTRYDSVFIDRPQGVYDAVHHLAKRGARRIAFLGTQEERTRIDGYERALRELRRSPIYLDYPGTDIDALRKTGRRFATQKARPDAVVAHSDFIALAFMAGLHDAGVKIPEEVALIGFDDRPAARYGWPALTTVAQPSRDIGRAGAEILLRKIAGEKRPDGGWSQIFPTRLVLRETA